MVMHLASPGARERPRFDLTMKKPGAEAPGSLTIRALRGVRSRSA